MQKLARFKCPCCERMKRKNGHAMCTDCWKYVPPRMKRAHQAIWRRYCEDHDELERLKRSITRCAEASRIAQWGNS